MLAIGLATSAIALGGPMACPLAEWRGKRVRITGLKIASQHNGKVGRVSTPEGEERLKVELEGSDTILSIKPENLLEQLESNLADAPALIKPISGAAGTSDSEGSMHSHGKRKRKRSALNPHAAIEELEELVGSMPEKRDIRELARRFLVSAYESEALPLPASLVEKRLKQLKEVDTSDKRMEAKLLYDAMLDFHSDKNQDKSPTEQEQAKEISTVVNRIRYHLPR